MRSQIVTSKMEGQKYWGHWGQPREDRMGEDNTSNLMLNLTLNLALNLLCLKV